MLSVVPVEGIHGAESGAAGEVNRVLFVGEVSTRRYVNESGVFPCSECKDRQSESEVAESNLRIIRLPSAELGYADSVGVSYVLEKKLWKTYGVLAGR